MKHEPRPAIQMEKQFVWACNLGGVGSLGISKVGETVLTRLMESLIGHHPACFMALQGEGSEKGQSLLLVLMSDTSASSSMPLVPFKLPPQC